MKKKKQNINKFLFDLIGYCSLYLANILSVGNTFAKLQ